MVRIQAAASGMNLLLNGMPLVRYTAKDKAKPVTSGAESWGAACKPFGSDSFDWNLGRCGDFVAHSFTTTVEDRFPLVS